METRPKLIILHSFAGVGKSTIAKRYIDEHPLSLNIEGDQVIVMIGQWMTHEENAREYVFALTKSMISTYLGFGKNVIVPYLLTDVSQCESFERIADQQGVDFFEVQLLVDKDEAIKRLMERGTWGEEGTPPITENDLPKINKLYDTMVEETAKRPNMINVHSVKGDIDATYKEFLEAIGETSI